jgi:predicted amidophosphoribosyltransferase
MICPYCKTELTEADNPVYCSVCEMPHHRDCWAENGGCTTFGCTGTIRDDAARNDAGRDAQAIIVSAGEQASPSGGDALFCTQCGNRQTMADNFCGRCGARLKKYDR